MGKHDSKFVAGHRLNMLSFVQHGEPVVGRDGRRRATVVLDCDCGKRVTRDRYAWLAGRQKSCGCFGEATRPLKHRTHGMSGTPLHHAWASMKQRTTPGTAANKRNYVGVRRDPRWDTFEGFLANQPTTGRPFSRGMQLARFNDVGDYTPENTRWLTRSENANEMLARRKLRTSDGRFAVDVARENGIPLGTWEARYYMKGVDIDTAVTVKSMR